MSILWCGGEDVDFVSSPPLSTTASYRRSAYSRSAFTVRTNPTGAIFRSLPFPGGAVTDCWLSWQGYWYTQSGTSWIEGPVIALLGASANQGIVFGPYYNSPNSYSYRIHKFDGTTYTTLVNLPIQTTPAFQMYKTDVQIVTFNDAATTIRVWVNGVNVLDGEYDTTGTGGTELGCVAIRATATAGADYYISEIIVADEDTRSFALYTAAPNGLTGWTGAYTDISEVTGDDATVIYTNTNDADALVDLTGPPAGNYALRAVMLVARAVRTADSTPLGLALGIKSGGSYSYGDDQDLDTGWGVYQRIMNTTNPATTNPWEMSELTGLQMNLRAKA